MDLVQNEPKTHRCFSLAIGESIKIGYIGKSRRVAVLLSSPFKLIVLILSDRVCEFAECTW